MTKEEITTYFNLNKIQIEKIEFFVLKIINHNKHTNLVGKSTIENIWDRHILDCLQLSSYINEKKLKILLKELLFYLLDVTHIFFLIFFHNKLFLNCY